MLFNLYLFTAKLFLILVFSVNWDRKQTAAEIDSLPVINSLLQVHTLI